MPDPSDAIQSMEDAITDLQNRVAQLEQSASSGPIDPQVLQRLTALEQAVSKIKLVPFDPAIDAIKQALSGFSIVQP